MLNLSLLSRNFFNCFKQESRLCKFSIKRALNTEPINLAKKNTKVKYLKMNQDNKNYIVWVDLEMSGLNIDKDHILEMACLITDKELNIVAEGPELIINQSNECLDSMDEWCKKTHGESGLTQACKDSKITITDAEDIMLDFIRKHTPKGSCPLAGNTIHMDRIFLNKYMKRFLDHLHYRIIDISSIKELSKRWYPEISFFQKRTLTEH